MQCSSTWKILTIENQSVLEYKILLPKVVSLSWKILTMENQSNSFQPERIEVSIYEQLTNCCKVDIADVYRKRTINFSHLNIHAILGSRMHGIKTNHVEQVMRFTRLMHRNPNSSLFETECITIHDKNVFIDFQCQ